jgi:allantoate deiminase
MTPAQAQRSMTESSCFVPPTPPTLGKVLNTRLETLAMLSDEPGQLTRLYLSPAYRQCCDQVKVWMEEAGMTAWIDGVCNVVGRYEGLTPDAPTFILGSHLDTVRDAGKYDGMLGVLTAIAGVQVLSDAGIRLPFAIEVYGFGNEEGVRFPSILTGSRAVAGTLDPDTLDGKDADDVSIWRALRAIGCDPDAWPEISKADDDVRGFLEIHIEQGPVLQAEDLPIGIVTAISGASRYRVQVKGEPGHAGTVPMGHRHDALAAAAEMTLAVERIGRSHPQLVATVGQLHSGPGASNVIPGRAEFTIDLRAPTDSLRNHAAEELEAALQDIATRRAIEIDLQQFYNAGAAGCSSILTDELEAAVERSGIRPLKLPSGAGHDGLAIRDLCPMSMLFVRCKDGISHNPAEAIDIDDAVTAIRVMLDFLVHLDVADLQGPGISEAVASDAA